MIEFKRENNNMKGLTMKRQSRKTHRMVVASVLTGLFFVQQTMTLQVLAASTITGVTNGGSGTFNVDPTGHKNGIGYRGYTDFSVGNGDIVNLNFKHDGTNLDTFVNMVTNQVNINGIVNSVRDGAFHNGNAVFISPNGIVVGPQGVINVGSLNAYVPNMSADDFNTLKNNLDTRFDTVLEGNPALLENLAGTNMGVGNAPITINGKIITTGDVNIRTQGKITVGETGGIAAGVKLENSADADALFNSLVNSSNINTTSGDTFVSGEAGNIDIISVGGGIENNGNIVTYGQGGRMFVNNTTGEGTASGNNMILSGTILNRGGNTTVQNDTGSLVINNGAQILGPYGDVVVSNITDTRVSGNSTNNGLTINGNIEGNAVTINNAGEQGLRVGSTGKVNAIDGDLFVVNGHGDGQHGTDVSPLGSTNDTGAMIIDGKMSTGMGNAIFYNTEKGVDGMKLNGTINIEGQAEYYNNGAGGLTQSAGSTATSGNGLIVHNRDGSLIIGGTFENTGDAKFENDWVSDTLTVKTGALINNESGTLTMHNLNGSFDIEQNANVNNNGTTSYLYNQGDAGFNIDGKVHSNGALTIQNDGQTGGLNVNTPAEVTGNEDILLKNSSKGHHINTFDGIDINGGLNVQGMVNAGRDIKITNAGTNDQNGDQNGNVVIGDATTNRNHYLTAGRNIEIHSENGSVLNYGVEKVLLKADNDLLITTTDGKIGLPVQQAKCSGTNCTGLGVKSNGSREFTKSINGMIGGKVKETTSATTENANNDYVINYAAIDSDMKIDAIKANGRVILTVDDSSHAGIEGLNATDRHNMVNSGSGTNIEGWGMSLISNGSIGTKDNKVTFIQNKAATNSMDALANENIYLKENSFDAYGRENETTQNEVCSMVAREGDLDVEFAGNTNIQNITAEGDMKVVTRGKELNIKNLGHVDDPALINNGHYEDYFGTADGWAADGRYAEDDFKHDILPNNATVKALDINHNIRTTDATIKQPEIDDGDFEAYAGSKVKIENAVIDEGKLAIHADDIRANGVHVNFGRDGYVKEPDTTTSTVKGINDPDSANLPRGYAIRPDDVSDTGRDIHERNYYFHDGDGDFVHNPTDIDDPEEDGDKIDATPLGFEEEPDEPETDDDTDNDTDIDVDTDIDTDTDIDNDTDIDTDTDTDLDTDTDTDTDNDPGDEPEPQEPSGDTDTDTDTDIDNDTDIDTDTDIDNDTDTDLDTDTDADADSDADNDTDTDLDTDTDTDTDIDPDPELPPPHPPTPEPEPEPEPQPTPPVVDGRFSYTKIVDNGVEAIDKRQYMRFNVFDNNQPIMMENSNNGINALLDISRGGIAVKTDNLQVGDVVPVHIVYGDIDIKADVKIVSKQNDRAGAQFVNLDKATANQLLYLSLLLEETPNISFDNNR